MPLPPNQPPGPTPWNPPISWTIQSHAADGSTPMRLTRVPGMPLILEGDISFLMTIIAELHPFIHRNYPN